MSDRRWKCETVTDRQRARETQTQREPGTDRQTESERDTDTKGDRDRQRESVRVRAGTEPVPNREAVRHILTAKELALGQENWFQSSTNFLQVSNQERLMSGAEMELS